MRYQAALLPDTFMARQWPSAAMVGPAGFEPAT